MESANKQLEKANEARLEANNPKTSPTKKKELLKEAYKYEMVAIDDQQTTNNLMEDVQEKYQFLINLYKLLIQKKKKQLK